MVLLSPTSSLGRTSVRHALNLVSGPSNHVDQTQQLVTYRPRHCAFDLAGPTHVQLEDPVAVGEGALCELAIPRAGKEDKQTQLMKGSTILQLIVTIHII